MTTTFALPEIARATIRAGRALLLGLVCLGSLTAAADARELVRLRVSQFTGAEPVILDSQDRPDLFVLDPDVERVVVRSFNDPAIPFQKFDTGPATYLPPLTPSPPANEAGRIEMVVTPRPGRPIAPDEVAYTIAARFDQNPSSMEVFSSSDGFSVPLDVIPLFEAPSARRRKVTATASTLDFELRWVAGNFFGEFGGGEAGFVRDDVVLFADACPDKPRIGCHEAGTSRIALAERDDGTRNALRWTWARGTFTQAELGDPTTTTEYALCTYDDGTLTVANRILPGGTCGSRPCWRAVDQGGFAFNDPKAEGGISRLVLKPGTGRGTVNAIGRGRNLPLLLPFDDTKGVVTQLVRTDGAACWTAGFPSPGVKSTDILFRDVLP